ncbi:MAG: hypothetical protein IJ672_07395 [Methanobrevibacter sp.]|nr:hypothetical protein [Methanobrevibacter sp.]
MRFIVQTITQDLKNLGFPAVVSIPISHLNSTGEEYVDFYDIERIMQPYVSDVVSLQYLFNLEHSKNCPVQHIKVYDKFGKLLVVFSRDIFDDLKIDKNSILYKPIYVNELHLGKNLSNFPSVVPVHRYLALNNTEIFNPYDMLNVINPHVNNMGTKITIEGNFVEVKSADETTLVKLQRINDIRLPKRRENYEI